jgi:hypothetical protein
MEGMGTGMAMGMGMEDPDRRSHPRWPSQGSTSTRI